ncbi:MAG: hypothetical protein K2Q12_05795 [Rickettsiales bacterium]|nr:hypothetical protein [Rickettsiales bacterium]
MLSHVARLKRAGLVALIVVGLHSYAFARSSTAITVGQVHDYVLANHFKLSGPGPYLTYAKPEADIFIKVYARADKFTSGSATMDAVLDATELVRQMDFTTTLCNGNEWWGKGRLDVEPALIPRLNEMKELLQNEVSSAAKSLFNVELSEAEISSIRAGKKIEASSISVTYAESLAKCDTNGGRSIYYKILVKSRS